MPLEQSKRVSAILRAGLGYVLVFLAFSARAAAPPLAESGALDPARTWVFAAGLIEWEDPDITTFTDEDRADETLIAALKARGVPEDHIVFVQDEAARKSFLEDALSGLLSRTRPGDFLIFYFSGHGTYDAKTKATAFLPYDVDKQNPATQWSLGAILSAIDKGFHGAAALFLVDSCHSGGVVEAVQQRMADARYVAIASAPVYESSTPDWTFTQALAEGFQGAPGVDHDEDGWITLREITRYTRHEMAFAEQQFAATWMADTSLAKLRVGRAMPPFPEPWHHYAGQHVQAEWQGKWYYGKVMGFDGTRFRVRYYEYGTEAGAETWVPPERLRLYRPAEFRVGAPVYAEVVTPAGKSSWVPAHVVRNWYGMQRVRAVYAHVVPREFWVGEDRIEERGPYLFATVPFLNRLPLAIPFPDREDP